MLLVESRSLYSINPACHPPSFIFPNHPTVWWSLLLHLRESLFFYIGLARSNPVIHERHSARCLGVLFSFRNVLGFTQQVSPLSLLFCPVCSRVSIATVHWQFWQLILWRKNPTSTVLLLLVVLVPPWGPCKFSSPFSRPLSLPLGTHHHPRRVQY